MILFRMNGLPQYDPPLYYPPSRPSEFTSLTSFPQEYAQPYENPLYRYPCYTGAYTTTAPPAGPFYAAPVDAPAAFVPKEDKEAPEAHVKQEVRFVAWGWWKRTQPAIFSSV